MNSLPRTPDLTADQIDWGLEPRPAALEALLVTDADIRRERDLFREMLTIALAEWQTCARKLAQQRDEFARERDGHRRLRELVLRPARRAPRRIRRTVTVRVGL